MVNFYLSAGDIPASQSRPSDATWSIRRPAVSVEPSTSTSTTPRSGKNPKAKKQRPHPYMATDQTKITLPSGETTDVVLFTPKEFMARLKKTSSTLSPLRPNGSFNTRRFPSQSDVKANLEQSASRKQVFPPMQGTPRRMERPRDPTRPTVELPGVMRKCWSDDNSRLCSWSVTNSRLNGRNDERDRSAMWIPLRDAVSNIWPGLGAWAMRHSPWSGEDDTWLTSVDEGPIYDPLLATKKSSRDRVGFHSS